MEYMSFASKTLEITDERTVAGLTAVIGVMDHGFDILHKGAFSKTLGERSQRVKHLWQHDASQPPIASILEMKEIGRGDLPKDMKDDWPDAKGALMVKRRYLDTPRGNEVLAGLKAEPAAITEMSFGYDPVKFDFEEIKEGDSKGMLVRNLREVRLWDTSDVNWGMNEATRAVVKSAMPFKDCGMADEGMSWEKPALKDFSDQPFEDMSAGERRRIASHYAWTANNPPESLGDLKLPHHKASGEGVGPAVWKGVSAAMGRLMQTGTQIPDGDRKAVYDHLAKHYEQFEKTPPEFKALELIWSVNSGIALLSPEISPSLKGITFDVSTVYERLKELDEILRAEPKPTPKPSLLTPAKLLQELAIRQRMLALS